MSLFPIEEVQPQQTSGVICGNVFINYQQSSTHIQTMYIPFTFAVLIVMTKKSHCNEYSGSYRQETTDPIMHLNTFLNILGEVSNKMFVESGK